LDAGGISWRLYEENYPGNCFTGAVSNDNLYRRKHNPFISFTSIQNNATRCAGIVGASQFASDLSSANYSTLPQFMFYTPNMNNDGHDTSLAYAANFASGFFSTYLPQFPNRTLIVITFDEADQVGGPDYNSNHIVTILLGSFIIPGTVDYNHFSHPSLTRLIEENWGLGSLGRQDATAAIMFPQPGVANKQSGIVSGVLESLISWGLLIIMILFNL